MGRRRVADAMDSWLDVQAGGQASLAAVLSNVGLFGSVHTCMAVAEA